MDLRLIPGTTYDVGDDFSRRPIPQDSPFAVSWWYRKEFETPVDMAGQRVWLNFDSINYRANIWLNGRQLANDSQVRGMYRSFEFDVTDLLKEGVNTLAVEVFPPAVNDFSITFVDWNPLPADKDMGLVREVYLLTSGPVAMRNVQVLTRVDGGLDKAHLTLFTDLKNASDHAVEGTLEGTIGDIVVSKPVRLAAGESTRVVMSPVEYTQLNLSNPQLWWPWGIGPQDMHRLQMTFVAGGVVFDSKDVRFGIREFTSELDAQQHRVFRINGRRIFIKGAGWTHDMMLRVDPEREESDIRYARDMGLNTLRLEGKMLSESFFETADRYGMMVMPGWCCCNIWEQWEKWTADDYDVARESLRDQIRRLRNHPSVFVFLYGSDTAPPPATERIYLQVLQEENWPNPYLASARDNTTVGAGRTGVKMTGPYDYVAPSYWLQDTRGGGAWGFNTETSPGPAIPVLESLREMLPKEHLWPIDDFWNFHAGCGSFGDVNVFTAALEGRYGKARDLEDYVWKSQLMTYEAERAMFEAFGRNKYSSATGVIQWMLNNAWPGVSWHLYDWYLRPGGGYFGTKKANEPLHVQYSYDDGSVALVNSMYREFLGYKVTAKILNLDLTEKFSTTVTVDIAQDSSQRVLYLPNIPGLSRTYFVRLMLHDTDDRLVSSNFYWLSTQPDVSDFVGGDYRFAPITTYADLTALENLPAAEVAVIWRSEERDAEQVEHVVVRNPSDHMAFFVHLTVLKGKGGSDIRPVLWDDNYFELLPGEEREVKATYARKLLGEAKSYVRVDGWNVRRANPLKSRLRP